MLSAQFQGNLFGFFEVGAICLFASDKIKSVFSLLLILMQWWRRSLNIIFKWNGTNCKLFKKFESNRNSGDVCLIIFGSRTAGSYLSLFISMFLTVTHYGTWHTAYAKLLMANGSWNIDHQIVLILLNIRNTKFMLKDVAFVMKLRYYFYDFQLSHTYYFAYILSSSQQKFICFHWVDRTLVPTADFM